MGIEFKEIEAWDEEGLTTVNIFAAVATVCSAVNKVRNDNPDTLIGLSGHSLGGNVAFIASSIVKIDFLILEDAVLGGSYDFVLKIGKFDLKNEAVISGLRKNGMGVAEIRRLLKSEWNHPPTYSVKGWFAIIGQSLFKSFPDPIFAEVQHFALNHHQMWIDERVIRYIARFIYTVNDKLCGNR